MKIRTGAFAFVTLVLPVLAHAQSQSHKEVAVQPNVSTETVLAFYAIGCTPVAGLTGAIETAPKYGTATIVPGTYTSPNCPGVEFPGVQANYTWTATAGQPGSGSDSFNVEFFAPPGYSGTSDYDILIWEGVPQKPLGDCTDCRKQRTNGTAIPSPYYNDPIDANTLTASTIIPGQFHAGDPIDPATGNVFESATDYQTAGHHPLAFIRYYNSDASITSFATTLGHNWRSNYDRYLDILSPTIANVERPSGQCLGVFNEGAGFAPDTDTDIALVQNGSTWTLTNHDGTIETYTTTGLGNEALLDSLQARDGYTQTMHYNASNQLASVTDSYGRSLTMSYNANGTLHTLTTPDGTVLTYNYTGGTDVRLASVTYPTSPSSVLDYEYGNAALPNALTGIVDENGNRYATWKYDSTGRGTSSEIGTGANAMLTSVTYNADGTTTVTNALGEADTYTFTTLQYVSKTAQINRGGIGTVLPATEMFSYDANGYLASATDWNGNETTYVNDSHGDPLTVTEAVGSPVQRTTTIVYDPTFVLLPDSITTPDVNATFNYDSSGELLTRTLTDTTSPSPGKPYSSNGETRTWTYSWANFLLGSVKSPLGNLTQYSYDATGALTAVTNALNQVTQITRHTGGGLPETIVDPNKVPTNLTYDQRQRLLTSTVNTSGGNFTTRYMYDKAGNLTMVTIPDGSALTNTFDTAHRLVRVTDLFGQKVAYTLDGLGDPTFTTVSSSTGSVDRKHSDDYDALGRVLKNIGGVGQTTTFGYDSNGNAVSITDPRNNMTGQAFDALNRLGEVTQPPPGGETSLSYDPHDRPLTVTNANDGVTTYVYDGFGDAIEQMSPDSGTAIYYYDADGNLTQSVDGANATANFTYDPLDRVLTTTYPSDASENVTYTYDQPGHGAGIGRLTSLQDAAGRLSRFYDQRGNVLRESRNGGGTTLNTAYTYDPASRVASVTYPDGWLIAYTRDVMGRITGVNATPPGSTTPATVLSGIGYEPFGPVNAMTYGNGVADARTFDPDYRMISLADTGTGTVQSLSYIYDPSNNLKTITDHVNSSNSQTLAYDALNELTGASGSYGTFAWTYDPVGNRLTQRLGSVTTTYGYTSPTNQLATVTASGTTTNVGYNGAGNISSFSPAFGTVSSLSYNQAERLSMVSGSGTLATYTYDAFGHRLEKATTGPVTLYQYDLSGNLLEETNTLSGAQADYIYLDGTPVATITPATGALSFLHDDHLGTPQLATGSTQTTVWNSGGYQPFGQTGTATGTITQNLRFPGQYFDMESSWNHNGFRDYVPLLGRYTEADPIGLDGGLNLYLYVKANPISRNDPEGLRGVCLLWDTLHDMMFGPPPPAQPAPIPNGPPLSTPIPDNPPESIPFPAPSPSALSKSVTCEAKCNVQQIDPNANCPERVFGTGMGFNQPGACVAAQRDANKNVPRGCYKRHCDCDCE
jgi:RHS repeat-associated protein